MNSPSARHTFEAYVEACPETRDALYLSKGTSTWLEASTLSDYGAATADWLEGKIGYSPTPTFYSLPNNETLAILPFINALNRTGHFASTHSQPASSAGNDPYNAICEEQRAEVSGFASAKMTRALARAAARNSIEIVISQPGSKSRLSSVVISRENGEEHTLGANVLSPEEIAINYQYADQDRTGLNACMITALQSCYQLMLCDDEYGRNDRLWPMITTVAARFNTTK